MDTGIAEVKSSHDPDSTDEVSLSLLHPLGIPVIISLPPLVAGVFQMPSEDVPQAPAPIPLYIQRTFPLIAQLRTARYRKESPAHGPLKGYLPVTISIPESPLLRNKNS